MGNFESCQLCFPAQHAEIGIPSEYEASARPADTLATLEPLERAGGPLQASVPRELRAIDAKAGDARVAEFGPSELHALSSGSSAGSKGGTLGIDADTADRVVRRSKGGKGAKFNYKALSKVQETNVDVQYRLEFFVAGAQAQRVVELVCAREGAQEPATPSRPRSSKRLTGLPHTNCIVRCRGAACRLSLTMSDRFDDAPTCKSAGEASSALCLRLLVVKAGDRSHESVAKQLLDVSQWLSERCQHRQRLCLMLCETNEVLPRTSAASAGEFDPTASTNSMFRYGSAGSDWNAQSDLADLGWESALALFEDSHGPQWKVGPLNADDPDTMHEAFLDIANTLLEDTVGEKKAEMEKITEYPSDGPRSPKEKSGRKSWSGTLSLPRLSLRRNSGTKASAAEEEPIGNFPFDEWSDPTTGK